MERIPAQLREWAASLRRLLAGPATLERTLTLTLGGLVLAAIVVLAFSAGPRASDPLSNTFCNSRCRRSNSVNTSRDRKGLANMAISKGGRHRHHGGR